MGSEPAIDRVLRLLEAFGPVKKQGREWRCVCPAHGDTTPSLDVAVGDKGVLLSCRSRRCPTKDICRALGIGVAELFDDDPDPARKAAFEDRFVRAYDYRDEKGELLFQAVRLCRPKDFRQRQPDGEGGWQWRLDGVRLVPYRLPELAAAAPDQPVYVVEGEKDADALAALGLVATTNAMGAGKWKPEYAAYLRGRRVVILPDNDEAGRRHAEQVKAALAGEAAAVKVVWLPGLPPKGDVSDWLRLPGNGAAELLGAVTGVRFPGEPEPWEPPIPLDDAAPGLPPFPLHVFPAALQDLVAGAAAAVGCPADYGAAHALAIAAGAVGASFDLQVKRGYYAPSNLWVCVVAPPGSGKSPAVQPLLAPVFAEQGRRVRTADAAPAYVSDVTVEKLAAILTDHPRGLLMAWDEMAGWLTGFNQYKGKGVGNDRAHYLSIWDGRALKVDRKGADSAPVFAPRPRLSVVGGIQPEVLDELRAGPSDGLFDRMLFSFPADHGLPVESFAEVADDAAAAWAKALGWLWDRPMHSVAPGEPLRPNVVKLRDEAKPVWQGWTRELSERNAEPDAPPYFRAVAAKVSGYAARIALVLHLLREAYGEEPGQGVGTDDLLRAVEVSTYFLIHADRVHRAAGRDKRLVRARAVLRWMAGSGKERFTRSDAWASLRRNSLFAGPEDLDDPLKLLRVHRCVRWADETPGGPGRPAAGRYELNPALRNGVSGESQTV